MPPTKAKFYDPDQVLIYFNGVLMQGYADGEFISVAQVTEAFTEECGTDGEVTRSKTNDRRAKVIVKLMQSSSVNGLLSAIHDSDLNTPGGAGVGTFSMQDLQGGTIAKGDQCWIVKYPDNTMDRSAKPREWEFRIASAIRTEGGN